MSQILLQCQNCNRIFSPGIVMSPGSSLTFTFTNCKARCPYCESMENIPDGTFRTTVEEFIEILRKSDDPIKDSYELLEKLKESKSENDLTVIKQSARFIKFSDWIPNTPERIAAYIAIVYTIMTLLMQKPDVNIEYNTIVNQYNNTINITFPRK